LSEGKTIPQLRQTTATQAPAAMTGPQVGQILHVGHGHKTVFVVVQLATVVPIVVGRGASTAAASPSRQMMSGQTINGQAISGQGWNLSVVVVAVVIHCVEDGSRSTWLEVMGTMADRSATLRATA
jgi:hypothetical protein